MVSIQYKTDKPCIKIYVLENAKNFQGVMDVCWGIEEEGIPYEKIEIFNGSAKELSYKGAQESVLGVGIGIDESQVVLNYNKLTKEKPLYSIGLQSNEMILRSIGANAARLVKKVPFKSLDEKIEEKNEVKKDKEMQIRELVAHIIRNIGSS